MRPIIGITCGTSDTYANDSTMDNQYVRAVESAGGMPIILPLSDNETCYEGYIDIIDGLLLSGGVDMDPSFFEEEPIPELGRIDVVRDKIEVYLTVRALEMGLPIFGICRGIQTLNVAAKGTLYQDINSQCKNVLKHRQSAPGAHATHEIYIEEGSKLSEIMGCTKIRTNTFHHQAVRKLAPDFVATAFSRDEIIECIEGTKHPFAVGVQFHPERMWNVSEQMLALFKSFVDASGSYKERT